jgi:hypothetical protein
VLRQGLRQVLHQVQQWVLRLVRLLAQHLVLHQAW